MARGFLVVEQDEETGDAVGFWDGSTLQEDMTVSTLVGTKQDARFLSGQLQAQYPEKQIAIMEGETTIRLITPAGATVR
jgi:hypothetical protein